MNLQEQIGALETGVDQLIQIAQAPKAATAPETVQETDAERAAPAAAAIANHSVEADAAAQQEDTHNAAARGEEVAREGEKASAAEVATEISADITAAAPAEEPTLLVGRPAQNEITMTIGGKTVSLGALQIGQLIEELANARASMAPEPPGGIPAGWRFASTKNPMMAVQKQSNGDRLLVLRHTGHGWVPFTFSPDIVAQMYMMLTQR